MITLASANVEDVKPETTSQQVDEYVRERLRKEVADGPRGTAARVAERLNIAPAHWFLANAGLLMMLVGGAGMFGGCVAGVNAGFVAGATVWGVSFVLAVVGRVIQSSK